MKLAALAIIAVLAGCSSSERKSPFVHSPTNLTEAEVRQLPPGVTFEEIEKRLRYYAHAEVAIPLISFEIEGKKEKDCMMLFDDSGHLRVAWSAPGAGSPSEEALVLWPPAHAGKSVADIVDAFEFTKEANQPPQTTPVSAPR